MQGGMVGWHWSPLLSQVAGLSCSSCICFPTDTDSLLGKIKLRKVYVKRIYISALGYSQGHTCPKICLIENNDCILVQFVHTDRAWQAEQTVWAWVRTVACVRLQTPPAQCLIMPPARVFHHASSQTRGPGYVTVMSHHTISRSLLQNVVSMFIF